MNKTAIVGIQGLPAQYGGFETLAENLITHRHSPDIAYTVYCSTKDYPRRLSSYQGADLKYIPFLHANGIQSIPYDILSLIHCILKGYDTLLILGVSGCIFLPLLRLFYRKKLIVNIDGLEHKRDKWGKFAKWFLRVSEAMAVKYADTIIADNKGIQEYVMETYHKPSVLITYGGDHVIRHVAEEKQSALLQKMELNRKEYAIAVCRIEPENNCHIILDAFAHTRQQLVFIGNWNRSPYGTQLKEKYGSFANIRIMDSIYDLDTLYTLRQNARLYLHGHSAGGTNPSLVEAMFFGIPILAYDVAYNRHSTYNQAAYFKNSHELQKLLVQPEPDGQSMLKIARQHYLWKTIVQQYESLLME